MQGHIFLLGENLELYVMIFPYLTIQPLRQSF